EVQKRQQCRPRPRIPGDDVLGVGLEAGSHVGRVGRLARYRRACLIGPLSQFDEHRRTVGGQGHLSTPPMTGSMEATAEMASATMPPSQVAATACRLVNEGSR